MAVDYPFMQGTNTIMHNTHVFDEMGINMRKIVDDLTKKRTHRMARVLTTRNTLSGNNGHFPKSEKARSNGHSYKDWKVVNIRPLRYALTNDHRNPTDGYPYVRNLVTGRNWSKRVEGGKWTRLTRGPNSGIFSTQMRNGLNPWLLDQRERLKKDIIKAINGKKLKDYK